MKKTSLSHPLRIDAISVPGTQGQIGMTLCPGKVQKDSLSGEWARDLDTDLKAIEDWGATIMLSLMQAHELKTFKVADLPEKAAMRLKHHLLPIPDGGIPDAAWEASWEEVGPAVRKALQAGGKVLLHCRGGLGRTGLLAARLLVEFGMEPAKAVKAVRKARPDTIETSPQERYVLAQKGLRTIPNRPPLVRPYHRIDPAMASRYRGCLLGGAVGDALGAPVEFMDLKAIRMTFGKGGIRNFAPAYGRLGAITDDTQMTLFTAEGLLRYFVRARKGHQVGSPEGVLSNAYLRWLATQGYSVKAKDFAPDGWLIGHKTLFSARAPGNTCISATQARKHIGDGIRPKNDSKGCGGVMRVAPIGLFVASIKKPTEEAFKWGCEAAAQTHGHPTGQLPAGVLAMVICELVQGRALREALNNAKDVLKRQPSHEETLAAIEQALEAGLGNGLPEDVLPRLGEGWVAEEALAIAIFCALRARNFEEGIVMAVNITGDSDSTGAITGNLLGAMLGAHEIPDRWLEPLELRQVIAEMADDLATVPSWPVWEYDPETEADAQAQAYWVDRYPGN